jgi:hypothetical protein
MLLVAETPIVEEKQKATPITGIVENQISQLRVELL